MTRKLSAALVVALVLVMALSVAAFAQGSAQDAPYAPQDGTGNRFGQAGNGPGVGGRAADGSGQGMNFVDSDGDGVCDNFVDEDGDGVCDNCDGQGGQMMGRRNNRSQTNDDGMGMRQGGRGNNGQSGNGGQRSGRQPVSSRPISDHFRWKPRSFRRARFPFANSLSTKICGILLT